MDATTNLQQGLCGVEPEVASGNPAIGAMVLSFFGTTWLLLGCLCNSTPYKIAAVISGVVGTLIFLAAYVAGNRMRARRPAKTQRSPAERQRDSSFNRINIVQWVCAGLSVLLLNVTGHPEWIMASIILIVGLHFFPLARLFQTPSHSILGLILVFIALALPRFVEGGPQSVVLPLATGCALLTFAALGLYRARLQLRG